MADIDSALAPAAAREALPLADSLVYATAQRLGAIFWTQGQPFAGLPDGRLFPKPPAGGGA